MSSVRPPSHSLPSSFARVIVAKFGPGRFLIVGSDRKELERQFAAAGVEAVRCCSGDELRGQLPNGADPQAEMAIWFYSWDGVEDAAVARALANAAENVLLVPGNGADSALRRPKLVQGFAELGFVPDY